MRRVFTIVAICSVTVGSLVGLVPTTSTAAPARASSTVWKLVNRTCSGNEVEAGRACFDPAGHANDWEQVGESSANGKAQGSKNDYTYNLPDLITSGQPNEVTLHAEVSQISDGGAHSRICVSGGFAHQESGDPCATTAEAPNGGSASADATITLVPFDGSPGQVVTVTVGFEEPGGYVNYSYKPDGSRHTVSHGFSAQFKASRTVNELDIHGQGTFVVTGPLRENMAGSKPDGSATVTVHKAGGTHTAHLKLVAAEYSHPDSAILAYRVVQSNAGCLPAGKTIGVEIHKTSSGGSVAIGQCGYSAKNDHSVKASVHLSTN